MANQTPNDVAPRVRNALATTGISGRKLAADLGLSAPYIARRLSGAVEFSASDLIAVATRLNIPTAELLPPATPVPVSPEATGTGVS